MKKGTILVCIWVSLFLVVQCSTAEIVIESLPDYEKNQYCTYDVSASGLFERLGEQYDADNFLYMEDFDCDKWEERITGYESITVNGTIYDCAIIELSWKMSFTLVFNEGTFGIDDGILKIEYDFVESKWISRNLRQTVKKRSTFKIYSPYTRNSTQILEEWVTIETCTYSQVGSGVPIPARVGINGSFTESYTLESTEKLRMNGGDWNSTHETEEISNTVTFEILSEDSIDVPAGTFTCLKTKFQLHNESDHAIYHYDEEMRLIKFLRYDENDTLLMTRSLKDYGIKEESDDDSNGSPGFESTIAVAAIGVALITTRSRKP